MLKSNQLEIFVVTYNRKNYLKNILKGLFMPNSPVRNLPITILDNSSTDGTEYLIKSYKKKNANLNYLRNIHNIGGDGNIAKAFSLASAEYFWILCDDDYLDFTKWDEVEIEISNKTPIIFVSSYLFNSLTPTLSQQIHQSTFVPACIYRNDLLTDTVMQNIEKTICTMFSQLCLSANSLVNQKVKVAVISEPIVLRGVHGTENANTIVRGSSKSERLHPRYKDNFWHIGFIDAIRIIENRNIRKYLIENCKFTDRFDQLFCEYLYFIIKYNYENRKNNILNIMSLMCYLVGVQKIEFFFCYLFFLFSLLYNITNSLKYQCFDLSFNIFKYAI